MVIYDCKISRRRELGESPVCHSCLRSMTQFQPTVNGGRLHSCGDCPGKIEVDKHGFTTKYLDH